MKTPEDEAFDDLARKQGAWGGGFTAKRQAAMDKINSDFDEEYKKMHEDRINYGTAWSQDGKRIDPMSVYKEPVTEREALKLALEALEEYADQEGKTRAADEAITAINMELKKKHMTRIEEDDDTQSYIYADPNSLTIAYQSGYYDGKKAALAGREWNFCERCGKRTADKTAIHTCTPPQENK